MLSSALRLRDPGAILEEVNQVIGRQSSALTFISVFFGLLNPKKSTLRYVNAGHNPPLVRRSTGEVERLSKTGPVLGVFDELQIKEERISLFSGDSIVLYTDGVTEAWHWNPQDEDYGVERLTAALISAPPTARPNARAHRSRPEGLHRECPSAGRRHDHGADLRLIRSRLQLILLVLQYSEKALQSPQPKPAAIPAGPSDRARC